MVEFATLPSYHPLDEPPEFFNEETPQLEKPIVPISQLGTTIPEHDPSGRGNLLQTIQANIRKGAGTMQLMMQTDVNAAIGGRAKAYGKEIREAIREVVKANEVKLRGIEMPTGSVNNLSGFNAQQRVFDEETRLRNIQEIKDTMKFAADIGGGGGVDLVSFEFPRPINDVDLKHFRNPGETQTAGVVDTRTGQIMMVRKDEDQFLPIDPETFEPLKEDKSGRIPAPKKWEWEDFERWARSDTKVTRDFKKDFGRPPTAEELYFRTQFQMQIDQQYGQAAYNKYYAESEKKRVADLKKNQKILEESGNKEALERLNRELELAQDNLNHFLDGARASEQHAMDYENRRDKIQAINYFGKNKSEDGYAQLGIAAMRETKNNPRKIGDLYVGPEIGWPNQYGGHPDEFKDLITNARKRMVDLLTQKEIKDPTKPDEKPIENPYYDSRCSKKEAEQLAKRHIKGMFDTGHMGMWWEHWNKDPKKSEEQNFRNFEKWYLKKMDELIKADTIGSIQVVDSATAAHGHLPPGQGIFGNVIKETMVKLKKAGFTGMIVSEGHEEERFGEGRILYKSWEHLGGYAGSNPYAPKAQGPMWQQMQHSYMGRTYSPLYMFGSYAPSNEFKLWSEVPLE